MDMVKDKPVVFVDLDSTVFKLVEPLLEKYNMKYNDNVTIDDITDWDISRYIKPECSNIFQEFCNNEFIYNTNPINGAIQTLNELAEDYHIVFLTASHPCLGNTRHDKLRKYFSWYDYRTDLIICGDKHLCTGLALIDDGYHNLKGNYSVQNRILITRPWNKKYQKEDIDNDIIRVTNWNDIKHVLTKLKI